MIDVHDLLERPETYKKSCDSRNASVDIDAVIDTIKRKRAVLGAVEALRSKKNVLAKQKPTPERIAESKEIGTTLKGREAELSELEEQERQMLLTIPNLNDETTPIYADPDVVKVIREVGEKSKFDFEIKDHQTIGEALDILDIEAGSRISGARFWYLKGDMVLLQFALMNYVMDSARREGFVPVLPPCMVRERAMTGTGFLPAEEHELYRVNPGSDDLYMIGTSEVPLVSYHADQIIDVEQPKRYIGYSSCFRREAGASGKDTRGIFRGHQFDKLEMVTLCKPEASEAEHALLLSLEESIISGLGLSYRILNIVSGDLGASAAKKYDIEGWLPSENRYREITSASNCTDFQARRLQIRYKDENGKNRLVHTLNGTACALGRMMLMIIEQHQQADGSVVVPEVLLRYGFPSSVMKK